MVPREGGDLGSIGALHPVGTRLEPTRTRPGPVEAATWRADVQVA